MNDTDNLNRDGKDEVMRIRKYANRRLYSPATSEFVTLVDLARMVKAKQDFVVEDAKTGQDLTSSILIQIIAEQEAKGEHLLPLGYLRQLIHFYGQDVGDNLNRYLEQSMQTFANHQRQMTSQMTELLDPKASPMQVLAERNMELFRGAMNTWTPFTPAQQSSRTDSGNEKGSEKVPGATAGSAAGSAAEPAADAEELNNLRSKLELLQQRMDELERR